jgi:hypothetical protein
VTTTTISRPARSAGFAQEELSLSIAEDEDAARLFYTLLKGEKEVEKAFSEFLVSGTPLQ